MNALPSILFDTLKDTNQLKEAGFSSKQAEGLIQLQEESMRTFVDTHLATKEDLNFLRDDISTLRRETREDIEALRRETREDIQTFRHETATKMMTLEHRIDLVFLKTVLSLGGMIGLATAVIACLMKF